MPIVHNRIVAELIKDSYSMQEMQDISSLLQQHDTFFFPPLENGLFPAARFKDGGQLSGYNNVWIRDNVYVALAHYLNGRTEVATKTVGALASYFIEHRSRFEKIIAGEVDFNNPMNRPHVRFCGDDLSEIDQRWAHAENDALGYFLWFFCKLKSNAGGALSSEERELLSQFALYFETIRFWEDEDSGHWEETRKIEASSIGVVTAALTELKGLIHKYGPAELSHGGRVVTEDYLDTLVTRGRSSLSEILPAESIQPDRLKNRRYDAALLFLIFPMNVVSCEMADQILHDVTHNLQGEYGVRRYVGDSYWCADYKEFLPPRERTADFSDNIESRNVYLKPGGEAQWCIFDPVISSIYGERYRLSGKPDDLHMQIRYLNRSFGQLTDEDSVFGGFKCPEAYYLEKGRYVPNDHTPLLWTQANLWTALKLLEDNLAGMEE